jgi:hypothetical protein
MHACACIRSLEMVVCPLATIQRREGGRFPVETCDMVEFREKLMATGHHLWETNCDFSYWKELPPS